MSLGFTQNIGAVAAAQVSSQNQQVQARDNTNLGQDPNIARAVVQVPDKTATQQVDDRSRSTRRPKHVDGTFASSNDAEIKEGNPPRRHRGKLSVVA